jgi:hypothetical protein
MKSPFCKVCFDTGKPESLYTSHYVNDVPGKKGVVVCPTLLSLECRYCKKTGHTVSRCPAITNTRKVEYARNNHHTEKQNRDIAVRLRCTDDRKETSCATVSSNAAVPSFNATVPSYATVLAKPVVAVHKCCVFQPRSPSTSPPPLLSWTDSMNSDSDDGSLCDDDDEGV